MYQIPSTAAAWTVYEIFKHYLSGSSMDGNPEEGNELLMDGVLTNTSSGGVSEDGLTACGTGGGNSSRGVVVQEKKFSGAVDRLRTLNVTSPLTASCSAAGRRQHHDENFLVK